MCSADFLLFFRIPDRDMMLHTVGESSHPTQHSPSHPCPEPIFYTILDLIELVMEVNHHATQPAQGGKMLLSMQSINKHLGSGATPSG